MAASTPNAKIVIRRPERHELELMADQHVRHLPHGLFPRLGLRFMSRWYATFDDSPYGVAYVAELSAERSGPVGFLVGSSDQARHVAWVVQHRRASLGTAGASALALRPALLFHFLRTRAGRYARRLLRPAGRRPLGGPAASGSRMPSSIRVAVLAAVIVSPGARGKGVGAALLSVFEESGLMSDACRAELVTLTGPGGAGRFYEKAGWVEIDRHPSWDGELVSTFRKDLAARRRDGTAHDNVPLFKPVSGTGHATAAGH